MQSPPFSWPLTPMTDKQKKAFDKAYAIAIEHSGGSLSRLATSMTIHTGTYISHQAFRNWKRDRKIPVQWALIVESFTDGKANFFDLVPWLLPRTVQYCIMIEQQRKSA